MESRSFPRILSLSLTLACTWIAAAPFASAQLVISGNENKLDLTSGAARVVPGAAADSLTLLDFSVSPPHVEHLLDVPNTVIGPPSNLAITPDRRRALVANSIRLDARSTNGYAPESWIHVVDLTARPPRVLGRVEGNVGRQPSGLSIAKDGQSAVIANRADGTVSVLQLGSDAVRVAATVSVCAPEEGIADVALHPGGKWVLASVQKGGYLAVLERTGNTLRPTGRKISVYGQPYRCAITADGRLGLTAGQGLGNGLDADALTVVDLTREPFQAVDYVPLGAVPESFEVSPDGRLVAAVLMNGSNLASTNALHSEHGAVVLLAREGDRFRKVQEMAIGRIPEGVAFTADGRHLVVQCHADRQLWVLDVRGKRLRDRGVRISVPGMPSSLRASP